jgi:hypothetical protein
MTADSQILDQHEDGSTTAVRIQLLHVPDCPLVNRVRATLRISLARTSTEVTIEELEGPYPSPTLIIDGQDVTGRNPESEPSCRLDLPTEEQILAALARSERAATRQEASEAGRTAPADPLSGKRPVE